MSDHEITRSVTTATVTLEAAAALIAEALVAARQAGFAAAVAVTDAGGALKAFQRTDGAMFLGAEVAVNKAWTAASYGFATHSWNDFVQDVRIAPLAHHPRLTAVGGGFPLIDDDGRLIGGLGISGGTVQQDCDVASAALRAVGFAGHERPNNH